MQKNTRIYSGIIILTIGREMEMKFWSRIQAIIDDMLIKFFVGQKASVTKILRFFLRLKLVDVLLIWSLIVDILQGYV